MVLGMSDELLGGFLPIASYWLYSGLYVVLDPYLDRYRIHTKEEELTKNIATKMDVIKGALVEQAFQISFFLFAFWIQGAKEAVKQPPLPVVVGQVLLAMFVLDTWQFFMHRLLHTNKFLYKHIHSKHHRIIVTYPYGAQFNHPVEGFILDTLGAVIAFVVSGMTPRTAAFFYTFSSIKGVEDHCGFYIPWNPFHRLFENNCIFHDVHHQLYGQKFNYATPFFNIWDRLFGTYLPAEVRMRKGGGYEVFPLKKE